MYFVCHHGHLTTWPDFTQLICGAGLLHLSTLRLPVPTRNVKLSSEHVFGHSEKQTPPESVHDGRRDGP